MKLSKLIAALSEIKRIAGNKEVLVSADPEGNSYGDLGKLLNYCPDEKYGIIIFPESNVYPD